MIWGNPDRINRMTWAQFEEKELEGPLNAQLSARGVFWSPGQVLEKIVGFDVAMVVSEVGFWASMGFGTVPSGRRVLSSWWPGWPSLFVRPLFRFRTPPTFTLNAFFQYKRPQYLSHGGSEWSAWASPYYRFDLTRHQQLALEACATSLGVHGLVAYGSPVFYQRDELFRHIEHGTLVNNTHFVEAVRLSGHARYTYVAPRKNGKAHSDPVDVEHISFGDDDGGQGTRNDGNQSDGPPPAELLKQAKMAARAAVKASPDLVGSVERFESTVQRAQEGLREVLDEIEMGGESQTAVSAFLQASVFSHMSGISWCIR